MKYSRENHPLTFNAAKHALLAIGIGIIGTVITLPTHASTITKVVTGEVDRFVLTPDGSRIIYRTFDQNNSQLLSQSTDGSDAPVRLDDVTNEVGSFKVTPDGTRVVYISKDSNLHGRNVDGSGLLVSFNQGVSADLWQISPDSAYVVYRHNNSTLYSRPIDGSGTSTKLSGPLVPGGLLFGEIQFTPDSTRVLYKAQQQPNDVVANLYSSPIDGSTDAVRLNNSVNAGDVIRDGVRISLDSQTAVFRVSDTQNLVTSSIFQRPADGTGSAVQLNSVTDLTHFPVLSPDGATVAYIARGANQNDLLYTSPVQGAGNTSIEISDSNLDVAGQILFTPDSNRLIYRQFDTVTGQSDLFSRSVDASGMAVKLSNDTAPEKYIDSHYQVMPDSSKVIYTREGLQELSWHISPVDGSAGPTQLHHEDLSDNASYHIDFELTPDGEFIVVLIRVDNVDDDGPESLFALSTSTGAKISLLDPAAPNALASVDGFFIGPDHRTVYYLSDQDTIGTFEVFSAVIPESGTLIPEPGTATLFLATLGCIATRRLRPEPPEAD